MPEIFDSNEADTLLERMKEIQEDERNPLDIRIYALKIETLLLLMDMFLMEKGMKEYDKKI